MSALYAVEVEGTEYRFAVGHSLFRRALAAISAVGAASKGPAEKGGRQLVDAADATFEAFEELALESCTSHTREQLEAARVDDPGLVIALGEQLFQLHQARDGSRPAPKVKGRKL